MSAHKLISFIIIVVVIGGGYYTYKKATAASTTPQYTLAPVRLGSIVQTVTGSGQVSSENQLDVTSEVSGKIQAVNVVVGQHVRKGDLLVSIDSHDAAISLESARIAYAKLVQPAKTGDVTNAENSLTKSYTDAFNAASTVYLDLPAIVTGMKNMLYGREGYLSDQNASNLSLTARSYRETAVDSYDKAVAQYQIAVDQYKTLTRASATSSIDALINNTYNLTKLMANALQNMQNAANFVTTSQPDYQANIASATAASINTWSSQINGDLSSIVSAQSSIASGNNSLKTLLTGAEDLDIQSQNLSLQQAQETYAKYFVRAPFDGIVGRIPVSVYGQAGASTVMATIIGDQKIANISLNEVDAAKVQVGQTVNITFDAVDGLNATGTVSQVDLVGTVTQGVVSYNVRIVITTSDSRIKPGMSLNVSIVTKEKNGVLVVPSSAIKTQGNRKYVEVLPASSIPQSASSTTRMAGLFTRRMATSTDQATSTENFAGSFGQTRTMTISSSMAPTQVVVTVGDTDDTNTEILTGLERGQLVVTRTVAAGSTTTTAPSILNTLGGNRGTSAGTGGGAAGARTIGR